MTILCDTFTLLYIHTFSTRGGRARALVHVYIPAIDIDTSYLIRNARDDTQAHTHRWRTSRESLTLVRINYTTKISTDASIIAASDGFSRPSLPRSPFAPA